MTPKIKIENPRGEMLDLSTDPRYVPVLTGTGPPPATINRSKVSTADGTQFNSASVDERALTLDIYLVRDVARARLNLYKFVATKQWVKVYYEADGLNVCLEGYVETVEVDPWAKNQHVQASIVCPRPFWEDVRETNTDASNVHALLEFPFWTDDEGIELSVVDKTGTTVIENLGTVETGATFVLTATNRSLQPVIYNLSTGEHMGFNVDLLPGDRLEICTITGKKRITHIRDAVSSNYINSFMEGSVWLQMALGQNEFSYTVDEGECEFYVYHTNMYTGV